MKVFVTKHVFTDTGVFEIDAERIPGYDPDVVFADWPHCRIEFHKPDWHETPREAMDRVLEMLRPKVECLLAPRKEEK